MWTSVQESVRECPEGQIEEEREKGGGRGKEKGEGGRKKGKEEGEEGEVILIHRRHEAISQR